MKSHPFYLPETGESHVQWMIVNKSLLKETGIKAKNQNITSVTAWEAALNTKDGVQATTVEDTTG